MCRTGACNWSAVAISALLLLVAPTPAQAQCGPDVPSLTVDLSSSPDATYLSPEVQRNGQCCGVTAPDQCLEFIITLHPLAQGINFDICEGAVPPGALFYQIDCGPPIAVGQPICLNGPGPHVLTFCKPGNNNNQYCITSIPPPTAGPGIVLNDGCTGTITSTGFAPGSILWTSIAPGAVGAYDGYVACPTCATTTVTGQTGAPAFVDYRICGNAIAPCSSNSYCDTVRVWFNPTLMAVIQPQLPTVCFGAAGTTITVVGGGGTPPYSYVWSTGATSASIFVGPGTYNVVLTDASDCPPTSASVVVTSFSQPIQALAGADIVVCGTAGSVPLSAQATGTGTGQWLTGGGSYTPSSTALNATYTPTPAEIAAGHVDLVLATTNNGTCPGDTDTVRVHFDPGVVGQSVVGTDATCNGLANGTASVQPATPSYSYAWNDPAGQSTATATGLTAGSYTVTITTALGCDLTLPVVIGQPAALAIAAVDVVPESCAGTGDGSATVTVTGGTAPYLFTWNNGAEGGTITAGAGTYTVSVTDANGCAPVQATAVIIASGQPSQANAGPDLIGCLDELPITLQGTVTNATGGQWSGGTGLWQGSWPTVQYMPSNAEILAGSATLLLTTTGNSSCPPASDALTVQLSNAFLNTAVSTTDVRCSGSADGTALVTPVVPGVTYAWNDPAQQTNALATGLGAGTYTVTATDALGCTMQITAPIGQPEPLVAMVSATTPVSCAGDANGSATVTVSGGTAPYTYAWVPGGQSLSQVTGLSAGTHTVTITDAHGCITQTSALIGSPAPLTLQAQVPDTVCVNSLQTLIAYASGGNGGNIINWVGLGTGSPLTHAFSTSQVMTVTVTDGNGCQGPVLQFPITVLDLASASFITSPGVTVCPGGSASVSAQLTGYAGPYTLTWPTLGQTGTGPFTVPVAQSMGVPVIVTDACGQMRMDTIPLTLETPPVIILPDLITEGCAPLTVQFPSFQTAQPVTYQWQLGNGSQSTQATPVVTYGAGTYTASLVVTTPAGCTASALGAGQILAYAGPNAAFIPSPWETDIDHPAIDFTDQSSGSISAWTWDFGDGGTSEEQDPQHSYTDIGSYLVGLWVEDVHGCVDSVYLPIRITPVHDIVVPNIFTPDPNGGSGGTFDPSDLSNDVFYPFIRYVDEFRMRIFNRWGELIFESDDIQRGWDGYYRGQLSPQDVYVYQLNVRFVDGKKAMRMGDVTLMR